jgi:hypothetical protein
MNCEGCNREVGDIKSLRKHRDGCEKYGEWSARVSRVEALPPQVHVYEGRTVPTIFA